MQIIIIIIIIIIIVIIIIIIIIITIIIIIIGLIQIYLTVPLYFPLLPCSSENSGYKEVFSLADILKIAVVISLVVFLLFLLCSKVVVRLFLPRETSEIFRHFSLKQLS